MTSCGLCNARVRNVGSHVVNDHFPMSGTTPEQVQAALKLERFNRSKSAAFDASLRVTQRDAQRAVNARTQQKVIETSFFGPEFRDGKHGVVVSTALDRIRNSFAEITVLNGQVVKVR